MPKRTDVHKQGGRKPRATLYFIHADTAGMTGVEAYRLVTLSLKLALQDGDGRFKNFLAYVEDTQPPGELRRSMPARARYPLPGEVEFLPLREVEAVLRQKLADEAEHKRVEGYQSYRPETKFLFADTCALVIGSPAFLFEHADLYLERTGILREKLFDFVKVLLRVKERVAALPKENSMIQVNLWEKQFYPDNFNALAERVFKDTGRLTEAEALARISKARVPDYEPETCN